MENKHILIPAILAVILVPIILYFNTGVDERAVMNAFHQSNMSIPTYVKVDYKNENTYSITYGLGGRTCTSLVKIEEGKIASEMAKECSF